MFGSFFLLYFFDASDHQECHVFNFFVLVIRGKIMNFDKNLLASARQLLNIHLKLLHWHRNRYLDALGCYRDNNQFLYHAIQV